MTNPTIFDNAPDAAQPMSFQEAIEKISQIFDSTPTESHLPKIRAFARQQLPNIALDSAVELCYRIRSTPLPKGATQLPPLEIKETVPVSEPVKISEVISEVKDYLSKYVVVPPEVLTVLVYFAASTWLSPRLLVVPYLHITSGAPGSGKTTVAVAVVHLSYRACLASSASSSAALSRICSDRPCTLLIDEIDSASDHFIKELTSLLNSGSSGGGDIKRLIVDIDAKGNQKVASLQTFGPKILVGLHGPSGIQKLQAATVSRCITVVLTGSEARCSTPLPRLAQDTWAFEIRRKLASMADVYGSQVLETLANLHALDKLPPRSKDKYAALVALASIADAERNPDQPSDTEVLFEYIRAAEVPEADIGRYLLAACSKALKDVIVPALKGLRSRQPPAFIQGMKLTKGPTKSPVVASLNLDPVLISGTRLGRTKVSAVQILQSGSKLYIRSAELLALLLVDESSPLQTSSAGRPMPLSEFTQHLKAYGCAQARIASHRGLIALSELSRAIQQNLDNFEILPEF